MEFSFPGVPSNGTPRSRARTILTSAGCFTGGGDLIGSRPESSSPNKTARVRRANVRFCISERSSKPICRNRKACFDLNQTGAKLERHAQSRPECFVDYLSRYLSLPCSGETKRGHDDDST